MGEKIFCLQAENTVTSEKEKVSNKLRRGPISSANYRTCEPKRAPLFSSPLRIKYEKYT